MGLFLDAANAWNDLNCVSYIIDIARKGNKKQIQLFFDNEDFPHLAGMQYAQDVDFGIRKAEYYGEKLVPALLSKRIEDSKIEESRNWNKIQRRLMAITNLQNTLDSDFKIVSFDKRKVRGFCQIDALFLIQNTTSEEIYFVFLDDRCGRYYCKSAFGKEKTNYMENQSPMTVLQKIKIVDSNASVLFKKSGYNENE